MSNCKLCSKEFPDDGHHRTRCGACNTKIRRIRNKIAAIKMLGGKCQICGWSGNIAAFEFHHTDSKAKEFDVGRMTNRKWEVVKKEAKKCQLLCSNCHRILHTDRDEKLLAEVENYRGKMADVVKALV